MSWIASPQAAPASAIQAPWLKRRRALSSICVFEYGGRLLNWIALPDRSRTAPPANSITASASTAGFYPAFCAAVRLHVQEPLSVQSRLHGLRMNATALFRFNPREPLRHRVCPSGG